MSLSDYEPPSEIISFAGKRGAVSMEVHGISTDDLIRIFTAELPQINSAYLLWQKTKGRQLSELKFLAEIAIKAPELVAEIICCASNQRSAEAKAGAAKLPIGVQVKALEAVYRLTLSDVGGLKNLLAILVTARADDALPGSLPSQPQTQAHH